MKSQNTINKSYFYGLFFTLIQATFFITIILSYENLTERFLLILMTVLSLLYPFLTFIMIYLYLKYENQKETTKRVEEFNFRLRKQRHDFLAHLQVISGLIDCDDIDGAKEYLEKIEAATKNTSLMEQNQQPPYRDRFKRLCYESRVQGGSF